MRLLAWVTAHLSRSLPQVAVPQQDVQLNLFDTAEFDVDALLRLTGSY